MRGWRFLLAGLIVWTVHFFALYIIASVFLTTPLARALVVLVTVICLAACALLLRRMIRSTAPTETDGWVRTVAMCGVGLSALAIVWQVLPAFLA
jgi:hypothetical protein